MSFQQNRVILVSSLVFLFSLLVVQSSCHTLKPCDFSFFYANTGFDFANDDIAVSIACLDPLGCGTIVLASAACGGCFSSGCSDDQKQIFTEVAQGGIISVTGMDLASGDMICSTGQVSVVSKDSLTTNDEAHEWPGTEFVGTRFAYLTSRASSARCTLFAFEETQVSLADQDGNEHSSNISAFSSQTFGAFDAEEKVLAILSDKPILASCWTSREDDFVVLEPVTTQPIYGFSSKHFRGVQVNCDTLANALDINAPPTCTDSNGATISLSLKTGDRFFEITGEQTLEKYRGPGVKCSPAPGLCITGGTVGDGDGYDGTSAFSARGFARYFVLPEEARQVVILSWKENVACSYHVNDVMQQLQTSSSSLAEVFVAAAGSNVVFPQGTVFNCSGDVYFVASHGDDEFNLFGLKPEASFTYRPPAYATCAPSMSQTGTPSILTPSGSPTSYDAFPTQSPSSYSVVAPEDNTTLARGRATTSIDIPMLAGWSMVLVLALGTLMLLIFVASRKRREEEEEDDDWSEASVESATIDNDGVQNKKTRPKRLPPSTIKRFSVILSQLAEEEAEERVAKMKRKENITALKTKTRETQEQRFAPRRSSPYLRKDSDARAAQIDGNERRGSTGSVHTNGRKPSLVGKQNGRRPSLEAMSGKGRRPSKHNDEGRINTKVGATNANLEPTLLAISKLRDGTGFHGGCSNML